MRKPQGSSGSGTASRAGTPAGGLKSIDHLLGRDLRQGGWFVRQDGPRAIARSQPAGERKDSPRGDGPGPDPAIIWALRTRRK